MNSPAVFLAMMNSTNSAKNTIDNDDDHQQPTVTTFESHPNSPTTQAIGVPSAASATAQPSNSGNGTQNGNLLGAANNTITIITSGAGDSAKKIPNAVSTCSQGTWTSPSLQHEHHHHSNAFDCLNCGQINNDTGNHGHGGKHGCAHPPAIVHNGDGSILRGGLGHPDPVNHANHLAHHAHFSAAAECGGAAGGGVSPIPHNRVSAPTPEVGCLGYAGAPPPIGICEAGRGTTSSEISQISISGVGIV